MKIENIVVFGCGAAGSNLLLNLVVLFPEMNYTIVDFDKVENRNIIAGTQPYSKNDVNKYKTQSLQRYVKQFFGKTINIANSKITDVKQIKDLVDKPENTLIIDAFDNEDSRNLFLSLPKNYHVAHVGFSANMSGEIAWNGCWQKMEKSEKEAPVDICQMHYARPFILILTSIAATICDKFIVNGKKENAFYDMSSDKTLRFE